MNRRALALRLTLIVAGAGLIPIALVGLFGVRVLARRSAAAAEEQLHGIADQVAARIDGYVKHQAELVRALAGVADGPDAERDLAQAVLDAPSLRAVSLLRDGGPEGAFPSRAVARARGGQVALSELRFAHDGSPEIAACARARVPDAVVCAEIDLLGLWRFVRRLRVGQGGYALVLDEKGRLLASGNGALLGAILEQATLPEAGFAASRRPPTRYLGPSGVPVFAGWDKIPELGWTVVVEQPEHEGLASARAAHWLLVAVLLFALVVSVLLGVAQARRVLAALEIDARWRTAGQIAAGITHDLGHRLRVLQQTAALADAGEPLYLPRIRDNLRAELATLEKFVADFSDLSRDASRLEPLPLELNALLESLRRTAEPEAQAARLTLATEPAARPCWVSADRYLLERALLNLVRNAIEASAPGGEVRLSLRAGTGAAVIAVRDEGSGIAPERLARLFDAFDSTKRTGAHLGIGLANVKRIAEALGGRVEVESAPGAGSTFRIVLKEIPAPPGQDSSSSLGAGLKP